MDYLQQHNEVQDWHKPLMGVCPYGTGLIIDTAMIPPNMTTEDIREQWESISKGSGCLIYRSAQGEGATEPLKIMEGRIRSHEEALRRSDCPTSERIYPDISERARDTNSLITSLPQDKSPMTMASLDFWAATFFGEYKNGKGMKEIVEAHNKEYGTNFDYKAFEAIAKELAQEDKNSSHRDLTHQT